VDVGSGGGIVGEEIAVGVGAAVRVGTCSLTPIHRMHPLRLRQKNPSASIRLGMRLSEQGAFMLEIHPANYLHLKVLP